MIKASQKVSTKVKLVLTLLFLMVSTLACSNQRSLTVTEQPAIITPFKVLPTWTLTQVIPAPPPTFTPAPKPIVTPTLSLPSNWYIIPELTDFASIDSSDTKAFKGIRIPPLPEHLVQEFGYSSPYGEVPSWTITYQIFLMRQGNARMLWLGVPFEDGSESRIYDAIPLPPTEPGDVLIPFTCIRQNENGYDFLLIVIAAYPEEGGSATDIHYAWRIDPASITLQPVSYRNMFCPRDW
jgi:hypothetical protein